MAHALPAPPDGPLPLWLAVAASYLLGALPFGYLMARARGVDLRAVGSGNIGATNTMRALGRPLGVAAFVLDFGKGWLPVAVLAWLEGPEGRESLSLARLSCGTAAVLGHCFPVYLRFKGGKGVATGCGAVVGVDPVVVLVGGLAWLAVLTLTHYVGLASVTMGAVFPLAAWWRRPDDLLFVTGCALLTLLIVVRHRSNLSRILAGTEPKSGR